MSRSFLRLPAALAFTLFLGSTVTPAAATSPFGASSAESHAALRMGAPSTTGEADLIPIYVAVAVGAYLAYQYAEFTDGMARGVADALGGLRAESDGGPAPTDFSSFDA